MKKISESQKQTIRDLYSKCGYTQNQIVAIFSEGKISKPTVAKILRESNLIEKKATVPVEENFSNVNLDSCNKSCESIESAEVEISEVVSTESVKKAEENKVCYTDCEVIYFEEFLKKRKSSLEVPYTEARISEIANIMTEVGEEKQINSKQMMKVADEILKRKRKLNRENLLLAVNICKNHNLI